jgi:hypothetical protein
MEAYSVGFASCCVDDDVGSLQCYSVPFGIGYFH